MKILPIAASALSLSACLFVSTGAKAQDAQPTTAPNKNIVLVHGAWVDGSGWKPVYDILTRDGYYVTMVQEPLTSLEDDVAATKRVIDLQDGPVILVAHSYGGSIITEAGVDPKVAGLVLIRSVSSAAENGFRRRACTGRSQGTLIPVVRITGISASNGAAFRARTSLIPSIAGITTSVTIMSRAQGPAGRRMGASGSAPRSGRYDVGAGCV